MEKIVISLTSYPARIPTIHKVIESLFDQEEKADEIVLWLSRQEFPGENEVLPDALRQLIGKNGFRIEWVNGNLKSHKKYFYALQNNENVVITIDDDMYYSKSMIHTLMESYRKHPNAISARNVHMIFKEKDHVLPYLTWESEVEEYIGMERMDLCAIGVNGILYPPNCANMNWFDESAISEYAENQDDLWLKVQEVYSDIPVVYTGLGEKDILIEESQSSVLYISNAYEGLNDICIQKLLEKLKKDSPSQYDAWFHSLLSTKEYFTQKKNYYKAKLREIIEKSNQDNIYIYGAGKYARIVYDFVKMCGFQEYLSGFLVSELDCKSGIDGKPVVSIHDMVIHESFLVICGVSEKYKEEVKEQLTSYKFHRWFEINIQEIIKIVQQ